MSTVVIFPSFLHSSDPKHFLLTIALLGGLSFTVTVIVLVIQSKRAGISDIPGPWIARYTDAFNLYATWKDEHSDDKASYHRQLQLRYGNVVRTGPRTVSVFDPAAVPVIYGIRSKLNKGNAYIPFRQPGVTTAIVAIQEESLHAQYRRLTANAYSMSSLKDYEPYVDEMVERLVKVCEGHADSGEPMNLSLWCRYYSFDVASKLALGQSLGFMQGKGQDVFGLIQGIKKYFTYISYVSQMPWLDRVFRDNMLMRNAKPSPFMGAVRSEVAKRLQQPGPEDGLRPDMLSHFIVTHSKNPELMDNKQVLISTAGVLVAGGLSPGLAFDELFRELTARPESQDKLYRELTEAKITMPVPAFDEVKGLPYLDGVLREGYRLHQSTSFDLQRVTGPNGLDLPDGRHLPAGINVGSPASIVNRTASVYGSDPDVHKPERWMKEKDESDEAHDQRRRLMERTDLTFGQGTRACIGKNIVALEFFKVVATLMFKYKFQVAGNVKKGEDLWIFVHRREKS